MTTGEQMDGSEVTRLERSEAEWRASLTPDQYRVLRERGTDRPFTGPYTHPGDPGLFLCAGCGNELFDSERQFDSGSGWPSFTDPVAPDHLELGVDRTHGMVRTEVRCRRCGGHLGHVFEDGPGESGLRWCINSSALELRPRTDEPR